MTDMNVRAILISSIVFMSACGDKTTSTSSSPTSAASLKVSSPVTDTWLGKWTGPEGTYIDIAGSDGVYTITIADLDGPKEYQGISKENQIIFERNGVSESLQTSDGAGTGMKWLMDKSNCLRVRSGEGWCRE
jgi:hypothetical protein